MVPLHVQGMQDQQNTVGQMLLMFEFEFFSIFALEHFGTVMRRDWLKTLYRYIYFCNIMFPRLLTCSHLVDIQRNIFRSNLAELL